MDRPVAVASTSSVRPSCSSTPPWVTTVTAKHETMIARTETSAATNVS